MINIAALVHERETHGTTQWFFYVALGIVASIDLYQALALCYYLSLQKSRLSKRLVGCYYLMNALTRFLLEQHRLSIL